MSGLKTNNIEISAQDSVSPKIPVPAGQVWENPELAHQRTRLFVIANPEVGKEADGGLGSICVYQRQRRGRLADAILDRMGDRPLVFVLGLMLVTVFLSMWMSNTAAAAIIIPISIIVVKENNSFHEQSRFAKGTVLAVAYAATIGGIGSLVDNPPNTIAAKYLGEKNIHLDFVEWKFKTLPFVVIALFFTWFLIFLKKSGE